MKELTAPIDKSGRVVLPKEVRDEFALRPGDVFIVSTNSQGVTLTPKREAVGLVRKGKGFVFSTGTEPILREEDVEKLLSEDRNRGLAQMTGTLRSSKQTR